MPKGIIINNISNMYEVENIEDKKVYKCNARGKLKNGEINQVVGDFVIFDIIDESKLEGIIEEVIDRKVYIKRPKMANLTQIIFVVSMSMPKPDLLLLDKQLAFAEFLNIKPIICLNKLDLDKKNEAEKIEKIYTSIGYNVIITEAKNLKGIEKITEVLKDNITAFSGNSGVGKSTLINGIFENNVTEEGLVSQRIKRGKNTTTSIKLYKLAENTYIADTPGFSTFDISEIESKDLDQYFREFRKYISDCEFIGCSHIKEEKCGIKAAIINGKVNVDRYDRYTKIYKELKEKEAHKW